MYVKWCHRIEDEEIGKFGHKGTILVQLHNDGFPVPIGFMVSAQAYSDFLLETGLDTFVKEQLATVQSDYSNLQDVANTIQKKIVDASVPQDIRAEILDCYDDFDSVHSELKSTMESLGMSAKSESPVAVKTTIVTKPEITACPQNVALLNARGESEVIRAVKTCWASSFTLDNMKFRMDHNLDITEFAPAVMIQQMVYPQKSGLVLTNDSQIYTIKAAYGLSEAITSGGVEPDSYTVDKDTGDIKQIHIQPQMWKYTIDKSVGKIMREQLSTRDRDSQKVSKEEAQVITRLARKIAAGFSEPLEIEWCLDKNKIKVMNVKSISGTKLITQPLPVEVEQKESSAIIVHRKKEEPKEVAPPIEITEPQEGVSETQETNSVMSTEVLPVESQTAVQVEQPENPTRLPITPEEEKTISLIANAALGAGFVDATTTTSATTLAEEVEDAPEIPDEIVESFIKEPTEDTPQVDSPVSAQELLEESPSEQPNEELTPQTIPIDFEEDTLAEQPDEVPEQQESSEFFIDTSSETPESEILAPEVQTKPEEKSEDDWLNDEDDDLEFEEDDSFLDDENDSELEEDLEEHVEATQPFIKTIEVAPSTEEIMMNTAKIESALNTCHFNLFGSAPDVPFFSLIEKIKSKRELPYEDEIKRIRMIKNRAEAGSVSSEDHSFVSSQTEKIVDDLCKSL